MSIKLMTAVWSLDIKSTHKLVLLALADNANDSGVCWPSVTTICEKSSLSERCVREAIQDLAKAKHLAIHERAGRSNYYTVTHAPNAPLHVAHPAPDAPPPLRHVPDTPAPRAPITIIEPPIEPPSGLDRSAWKAWQEYRKLKPGSIAAAQRKLAKLGDRQAETVEHCIANGYKGLFPPTSSKTSENPEWQIVRAAIKNTELRPTVLPVIREKVGRLGGFAYLGSLKPFDLDQKRREFESLR